MVRARCEDAKGSDSEALGYVRDFKVRPLGCFPIPSSRYRHWQYRGKMESSFSGVQKGNLRAIPRYELWHTVISPVLTIRECQNRISEPQQKAPDAVLCFRSRGKHGKNKGSVTLLWSTSSSPQEVIICRWPSAMDFGGTPAVTWAWISPTLPVKGQ